MGHPAIVVGTEKTAKHFAPFIPSFHSILDLPQARQRRDDKSAELGGVLFGKLGYWG